MAMDRRRTNKLMWEGIVYYRDAICMIEGTQKAFSHQVRTDDTRAVHNR